MTNIRTTAEPFTTWLNRQLQRGHDMGSMSSVEQTRLELLGTYVENQLLPVLDCTMSDILITDPYPQQPTLQVENEQRRLRLTPQADGSWYLEAKVLNGKPPSHALQYIIDSIGLAGRSARYYDDHKEFVEWFPDGYVLYTFLLMLKRDLEISNRPC